MALFIGDGSCQALLKLKSFPDSRFFIAELKNIRIILVFQAKKNSPNQIKNFNEEFISFSLQSRFILTLFIVIK